MKIIQGITQIFTFMLPPFIFLKINKVDIKYFFGFNIKPSFIIILLSIILFLVAYPMIDWLLMQNSKMILPDWLSGVEEWMQRTQTMNEELMVRLLGVTNIGGLLLNILIIAIIPAIGEELLFRGILQKMLTNKIRNYHWAIIITSIIFSAVHMEFYSFLPRVILGMILGYTFYYTGNIIVPMVIHFVNNTISIVMYYYCFNYVFNGEIFDMNATSEYTNIYFALASLIVTGLVLFLIKRQSK
ncbi:CPBP family intramembrane metalloprotease [Bacteroidales bacterium OttesenSCG-928-K03]|nr:CPBP family intramembrane metalloprotease [Bacteroidales bacterium OttesenSCG-928-K03]